MPFFSRVFKSKDGQNSKTRLKKQGINGNGDAVLPPSRRWDDAYARTEVELIEVEELVHICTQEVKSKALDMPFLLLPFRPTSDPSAARTFIRNFFKAELEGSTQYRGERLQLELRLVEPLVLCSILKWCWGRLPGGVVTWDAYKLFRIGEQTSNMARHAFESFIPLSVESDSRRKLIFDFFDLLAAISAHSKKNGLGGRKLSRMAGWWAFEHSDQGKGFEGGYKSWESAADATSHLFFAYLRSLSPDSGKGVSGFSALPRSLQSLVAQTEYPPEKPPSLHMETTRVLMIVNSVSPTPFALLRRARNFEYRNDDWVLQEYSRYDDPVQALTDECRRVLRCISSTNQSSSTTHSGDITIDGGTRASPDATWSQFEDLGFSGFASPARNKNDGSHYHRGRESLRSLPENGSYDLGRPTTPSWADFLSAGFVDEPGKGSPPPLLLPHDKVLPPLGSVRIHSSQSHMRGEGDLEPGELASITQIHLDDTFWWVWMTSLAGEEPAERKAVFGRCALVETDIAGGRWLIMEEQVKGAATAPEEGAYIAEKKSRFGFTRRKRITLGNRVSSGKKVTNDQQTLYNGNNASAPRMSNASVGSEQHAKVQAAAVAIAAQAQGRAQESEVRGRPRGKLTDYNSSKTNSVNLQSLMLTEAATAMKWASKFDKNGRQSVHLDDIRTEEEKPRQHIPLNGHVNGGSELNGTRISGPIERDLVDRELPALPNGQTETFSSFAVQAGLPPAGSQIATRPIVQTVSSPVTEVPPTKTIGRKPVANVSVTEEHPAFRKDSSEQTFAAMPNGRLSEDVVRTDWESSLPSSPRLRKSPSTGFKRLFRKRREDSIGRVATPVSQADSGLNQTPQFALPGHSTTLQKEDTPAAVPMASSPIQEVYRDSAEVVAHYSEPGPILTEAGVNRPAEIESAPVSPVDTIERRDAEYAFDRFAQGPLEHVPAFAADDSPQREPSPEPQFHEYSPQYETNGANLQTHEAQLPTYAPSFPVHEVQLPVHKPRFQTLAAARLFPMPEVEEPASPPLLKATAPQSSRTYDDISEKSVDLQQEVSPVQDRWAQIRKNAAERAARASEEQSMISQSVKTDDGETSGEETIEARVARIKARVAELTGAQAKPMP